MTQRRASLILSIFADAFVIIGFIFGWIFECISIGFYTGIILNRKLVNKENEVKK